MELAKILEENTFSQDSLYGIRVHRIQYFKKANKLKVIVKSKEEVNKNQINEIKKAFFDEFKYFNEIEVICYRDISGIKLKDICEKYWIDIINGVLTYIPFCKECLVNSKKEVIDENTLELKYGNDFLYNILKEKKFEKVLSNTIKDIFGVNCKINFILDHSYEKCNYLDIKEEQEALIVKNIIKESRIEKTNSKKENNHNKKVENKNSSIIVGKNINEEPVDISTIDETSGIIAICGDIFKTKIIETKTGRKIVTFYITDYTSSITVKLFPRPKDAERIIEEIKEGLYCKIRGEVVNDSYAREIVIMARDIVKLNKIEKMDMAKEKRVELHLHTKMSAMDGMNSAESLVKRAAKWGHKAVAITDHGVVQAYPEAMEAAKKYNIKIIYGVEGYLVDDGVPIAINAGNRTLDDTYVVFDIETTGFSNKNDKIIEIGAVKIKEGKIIDKYSTFVNPERIIPEKIVELTGIQDYMVKDAPKIEEVLPEFMEFVADSILVAHNANFDVSFIKKNCKDMGINFNSPILDTIPLCKFLYPELKRYKLNIVAKHLGIPLLNHHRAVEDAKTTGDILLRAFEDLKDKEIFTLNRLNEEYFKNQDIKNYLLIM
ncbi:DNA polymerase III PolC [Clostridium cochlearium]|nr:DNA polymerase III PolC [Clostridium cochlearium]STA92468.1 DNA polymerase III PolC [Clostridium cochlearium]